MERLIDTADRVLSGEWPVFDRSWNPNDLDWFTDPRTGLRAPSTTLSFDINHRDEDTVGNVKYIWEPSRHHHVTVLAAAFFLTEDDRYGKAAALQLRSWWQENPFLSGIHWTSAIEMGVRMVSWVWTRRLLADWDGVADLFDRNPEFHAQLHHHQQYLDAFKSRGTSANNHLLVEMAGQFVASCAFPWFAESDRWRTISRELVDSELQNQTFDDGVNRELASSYHAFVAEFGLAAAIEGEVADHPLGAESWTVLRRMLDAAAAMVDARLHPPRQGDDDNAHSLLVDAPEFERWASLLATGRKLFGSLDWWPSVPDTDVRTALWTSLARPPARIPGGRPRFRPSQFPDAGMTILRGGLGGKGEVWCRFDHGPHGYLAIAAHAHADALSIELRVDGVEVLADPGTYVYHGDPAWRSYFRSTFAHNTIEIAGLDQSVSGGPFLWTHHASTFLEPDKEREGAVTASHTGYQRFGGDVLHRRTVEIGNDGRFLVFEDVLTGVDDLSYRMVFHLGSAIECDLEENIARLKWDDMGRTRSATFRLPGELAWQTLKGQLDPPAGWYSPRFDVLEPSMTLVGTGRGELLGPLKTVLEIDFEAERSVMADAGVVHLD